MINPKNRLVVVWAGGDREVALKMVFKYIRSAKSLGWWDDITLVIWGPSSALISKDREIQREIRDLITMGVVMEACRDCADGYSVTPILESLGIEVRFMGRPLTDYIKEGRKIISF